MSDPAGESSEWRTNYAGNYWKTKSGADYPEGVKLAEAFRVLEEEPHKLTRDMRNRIEEEWNTDLVEAMREMNAPGDMIDAVVRATEGKSGGGGGSEYSIGEYAKDVGSGRDYGRADAGENYFKGREAKAEMGQEFLRGLESYSRHEINNLKHNNKITIAGSDGQLRDFVRGAIGNIRQGEKLMLGKINGELAQKIYTKTGVDLKGHNLELRANEIKHAHNEHSNQAKETPRGQIAITADDIAMFPKIINDFDNVIAAPGNALHFTKDIGGQVTAVSLYAKKGKSLSLKTMYKRQNRSGNSGPATNVPKNPANNVRNDRATVPATTNLTSPGEKVNSKN